MINKYKEKLTKYFSIWPKTAFVIVLIVLCATTTYGAMKKTVNIVVDGQKKEIVTLRTRLDSILKDNNIKVESKDKVSVALNSKVKDGDIVNIHKAVDIVVNVDGEQRKIATAESTVENMLQAEKINLGVEDKVSTALSDTIKAGMEINITRVSKATVNEVKQIAFQTEYRDNDNMAKGTQKVVQEGKDGQRTITTEIVYENGTEVSRRTLKDNIDVKPVKQIVDVGVLSMVTASRGGDYAYTKVLSCSATAYSAERGGCGTITATGTRVRRDPNGYSTVAVDPRVIPLGTRLYIEGYGLAIAEDTGGAIKGNIIDLYFNTYNESCNWGRRTVKVYILK